MRGLRLREGLREALRTGSGTHPWMVQNMRMTEAVKRMSPLIKPRAQFVPKQNDISKNVWDAAAGGI